MTNCLPVILPAIFEQELGFVQLRTMTESLSALVSQAMLFIVRPPLVVLAVLVALIVPETRHPTARRLHAEPQGLTSGSASASSLNSRAACGFALLWHLLQNVWHRCVAYTGMS